MTSQQHTAAARKAYEWVRALVAVVVGIVLVFAFAVRIVRVDGSSMRETLQDRDLLVVVNRPLSGDPGAGDVVVVRKESFEGGAPIVKRVIATAGQTVDIDFAAGVVYVDGAALEEPYVREPTWLEEGTSFPLTVPEGCVFLLGDNRNGSKDSRHPDLGTVDVRYVIGRAVFLAVPGPSADTKTRAFDRVGTLG